MDKCTDMCPKATDHHVDNVMDNVEHEDHVGVRDNDENGQMEDGEVHDGNGDIGEHEKDNVEQEDLENDRVKDESDHMEDERGHDENEHMTERDGHESVQETNHQTRGCAMEDEEPAYDLRRLVDRSDHVVARAAAQGRLHHNGHIGANEHHAVAWVGGGLLYSPTARALTQEARHEHQIQIKVTDKVRSQATSRPQLLPLLPLRR